MAIFTKELFYSDFYLSVTGDSLKKLSSLGFYYCYLIYVRGAKSSTIGVAGESFNLDYLDSYSDLMESNIFYFFYTDVLCSNILYLLLFDKLVLFRSGLLLAVDILWCWPLLNIKCDSFSPLSFLIYCDLFRSIESIVIRWFWGEYLSTCYTCLWSEGAFLTTA